MYETALLRELLAPGYLASKGQAIPVYEVALLRELLAPGYLAARGVGNSLCTKW